MGCGDGCKDSRLGAAIGSALFVGAGAMFMSAGAIACIVGFQEPFKPKSLQGRNAQIRRSLSRFEGES